MFDLYLEHDTLPGTNMEVDNVCSGNGLPLWARPSTSMLVPGSVSIICFLQYMNHYPLSILNFHLAQASWGQMSISAWGLEVLRELRWWQAPSCNSCPWGFILLGSILVFGIGLCLGSVATLLVTSQRCRGGLILVLRLLTSLLQPTNPGAPPDLGVRLAQYRRP